MQNDVVKTSVEGQAGVSTRLNKFILHFLAVCSFALMILNLSLIKI